MTDYLKKFIEEKCIYWADPEVQYSESFPKGRFPAGNPSRREGDRRLFVLRNLLYDFKHRTQLMYRMYEFTTKDRVQYAGLEAGAIPLLMAIQAYQSHRYGNTPNIFSVRKERKNYGISQYVNGQPNELPVVMVDDFISSGRSIQHVASVVTDELKLPLHDDIMTIINGVMATNGPPIKSIYLRSDFKDSERVIRTPKDIIK